MVDASSSYDLEIDGPPAKPMASVDRIAPTAIALVDYDNIKPIRRESTVRDAEANLSAVTGKVVSHVRSSFPETDELNIRVYGGWLNELGDYTQSAQHLLATLHHFRSRASGLATKPTLATTVACNAAHILRGTYRGVTGGRAQPGQEMVDSMIVADAIFFSQLKLPIIVYSDDV